MLDNIVATHKFAFDLLTLSVNLLQRRRINVRHGVQIEIEESVKSHELRGRAVISGESGRETVL